MVKNLPTNAGDLGSIMGWEEPVEKEMATYSIIFAWEILAKRIARRGAWWATVHRITRVGHDLMSTTTV